MRDLEEVVGKAFGQGVWLRHVGYVRLGGR